MKIIKIRNQKLLLKKIEFVKNNAPKIVAGIEMIAKFFEALKKDDTN